MSMSFKSIVVSILCAALASCHATNRETASQPSTLRTITLPRFQANLPEGPGREAFASSCLSCHSARYISIQPPLTAAKWEESVRKMIKTYAAPIAEEQVPQIVQYLMATKEADPNPWSAMTPVLMASVDTQTLKPSADLERGAQVYAQNCASCHGAKGAGDGATANTMLPRPTDLTSNRYSDETLSAALLKGVPATAMPGYSSLPKQDLPAVLAFTKNLGVKKTSPAAASDEAKALFVKNCIECHGEFGSGDGMTAASLPRPPTNFRAQQPRHDYALRVISEGVAGTAMPAWKTKLSQPQRQLLADYVRTFYAGD